MLLDNIWIINLDRSQDRMKKIKNNFDSFGLKYNRFSAIYGKNVSTEYLKENVSDICKYFLCNYGIIGCAASHKALWRQLLNSSEQMYVIFEDDVEINQKTIEIIGKLEKYIKDFSIDYLNLNCVNVGCSINDVEFTIDGIDFGKPKMPFLCSAYIITRTGANKLLKYISKTTYHVDFEILFVKFFKDLKYYAGNPSILKLTNDNTTIAIDRKTLSSELFNLLNLNYIGWFINVPIFTINLYYEISLLIIILLILLLLNIKLIDSKILFVFIITELILLNINYF